MCTSSRLLPDYSAYLKWELELHSFSDPAYALAVKCAEERGQAQVETTKRGLHSTLHAVANLKRKMPYVLRPSHRGRIQYFRTECTTELTIMEGMRIHIECLCFVNLSFCLLAHPDLHPFTGFFLIGFTEKETITPFPLQLFSCKKGAYGKVRSRPTAVK